MAGERCNLGKDEAELLKPSSPSSTSTPNPFLSQLAEKTENNNSDFISIKSDPPKEIPPEFLSQLTQKSETNNSDFVSIQSDPPKEIPHEFLSQLSEKSEPNNSAIVPQQLDHPKETSQESTKPAIGSTKFINRCSICSKRVGLTGFRCRCGDLFCGSHRYSDTHDCSFDYKAAGRAEILKNNPVVRAAKIIKI